MRPVDRSRVVSGPARALACGLLVLLGAVGSVRAADAAHATPPPDVTSQVTDPDDALGERTDEVADALARLAQDTDVRLYVVLVPTFDGMDGVDWANASASASGLGTDELLLAVATDEERHGLSADTSGVLGATDVDRIRAAVADPLRERDWPGSVLAAVDATRASTAGSSSSSSSSQWLLIGAAVVLTTVLVALIAAALLSRRRAPRAEAAPDAVTGTGSSTGSGTGSGTGSRTATGAAASADDPLHALERRADTALVALDDAVRSLRDSADEPPAARSALEQACAVRLRVEQAPEGTDARELLSRVLDLCATATAGAPVAVILTRRDARTRGPAMLDAADTAAQDVLDRSAAARATLATLADTWPAGALELVAGNPVRAADLAVAAQQDVDRARSGLAERGGAGVGPLLQAAQDAVTHAQTLLDAVDGAGTDLVAARAGVERGVRALTTDVAVADRFAGSDPAVAQAVDAAAAALAEVGVTRGGGPFDELTRLVDAEAALDAALRSRRDAAERSARANALLREVLAHVPRRLRAVGAVVATLPAAGVAARTRLREAERLLGEAQEARANDPEAALQIARRADLLAAEATTLVVHDLPTPPEVRPREDGSPVRWPA